MLGGLGMERPLEDILADFDETREIALASTIPGSWYTDARVFELEKRAVFGATWQLVGRAEQVAKPGEFVTATVGDEPIVVVRGQDGILRGFFNVCRHHAAAVVTEAAGCKERLRCPYHGWTYGLDGQLRSTPEFEGVRGFQPAENGLVPLAVTVWENFVFVHLDADPPPLGAGLGTVTEEVAKLGLAGLEWVERREWVIGCNWKVFVDNYLDGGYHIPFLHRGLNAIVDYQAYAIECFERACLQSSPATDTHGTRNGAARYWWIYPNLMLNWYEGYLDTNLVVPLGVDRMKVVFDFYFAPSDEAHRKASIEVSERIQDEDHAICESVQRGLGSRAYRAGRLSARREAGENLFHRLLAADLRRGREAIPDARGAGQAARAK